jgi:hypothetical protein
MDLDRRAALLDRLRPFGLDASPPAAGLALPLVTLDDFFIGNDDARSIGPQIGAVHPGVDALHAMLQAIAARGDVDAVLVQANDAQWAYDSDDEWVAANCVVVLTSAEASEVAEWRRELGCTALAKGLPEPEAPNAPPLRDGVTAWRLIWT